MQIYYLINNIVIVYCNKTYYTELNKNQINNIIIQAIKWKLSSSNNVHDHVVLHNSDKAEVI